MYFKSFKYLNLILLTIWSACLSLCYSQNKEYNLDSLKTALDNTTGIKKFNTAFEIFRITQQTNLKGSEEYARLSLDIANQLGDTLSIIKSNNALGFIKKELGFPKLSIPYFERALKLARKINERRQIKFLLNNLGHANQRTANFAKALEYHLESLKLREEDKDTTAISVALNNLGVVYKDMDDYENAFTYFKKNYDIKLQAKEFYDFELALTNLADVSNALGLYSDARKYLNIVFDRCKNQIKCDNKLLALAHQSMGIAYLNSANLDDAEKEFLLSASLFTEINSPDRIDSYHALATVHFKMGDYDGTIEKLNIAQSIADELEIPKYLLNIYKLYGETYARKNDFKKSSEYQKKYITLNDKIFNADLIKGIARVQAEHQEEQNLATIAAQDLEISKREEILNYQRKQFLFMGIIAGLLVALVTALYINDRRQRKVKALLQIANATIAHKNKELNTRVEERTSQLASTNEALKKANAEMDHFIYKTSHDIRGPISSLKGLSNLAHREIRTGVVAEYLEMMDLTTEKLNRVLWRLQIVGRINGSTLTPELIDFQSMVDGILIEERQRGIPPRMKINVEIENGLIVFSDKQLLKIILENLIDNGIKYRKESSRIEPFVNIKITGTDSGVKISVLDNGIGIETIPKEEIFKMFVRASERSETGGIGLYLIKISTVKLGGSISMNIVGKEKYTEFEVNLPSDLNSIIKQREEAERKLEEERIAIAQQRMADAKAIEHELVKSN